MYANLNKKKEKIAHVMEHKDYFNAGIKAIAPKVKVQKRGKTNDRKLKNLYQTLSGKKLVVTTSTEDYFEEKYFEKFLINELLNLFYSFFSMVSGVAYFEFSVDAGNEEDNGSGNYVIYLYSCTFLSICLWINIILESMLQLEYDILRKVLSKDSNIFNSGRYKSIIYMILVFFIHPNPITENLNPQSKFYSYLTYNAQANASYDMKFNYLFCIVLLLRSYYIFRFYFYYSGYMHPDSNRICKKYFFDSNLVFSYRCLVQNRSILTYIITLVVSLFFFAFSIRVYERNFNENFKSIWNSLYYVLVTMTTVGYGDLYATSNEGRVMAMLSCLTGVFLTSLMIVSVTKLIELSPTETNSLEILERIYSSKELEESSKKVVLQLHKILKSKHSLKKSTNREDRNFRNLKKCLKDFTEINQSNKFSGESTFNTIYNSLSIVSHDQTEFSSNDVLFTEDLKKLKTDLDSIFELIDINN